MTENDILLVLILFCFGSVVGWIGEFIFRNIEAKGHKLCNPGLCTGPYLPIYGAGICLLYFVCSRIGAHGQAHPVVVCVILTVLMTILEFAVGTITLKWLHLRLWDYRDDWLNYNGIICPLFSLIWGAIASVYYFFIHPYVDIAVANIISWNWSKFFLGIFYGIFAVDLAHSLGIATKLKKLAAENEITILYDKFKNSLRERVINAPLKLFEPLRMSDVSNIKLSDVFSSFVSLAQREKEEFLNRLSENDLRSWYIETEDGEKLISVKYLLIFMPAYLLVYFITSRGIPVSSCHPVYCSIDEIIPIIPLFSIPYVSWNIIVPILFVYLFKTNITGFRRFAKYLMITSTLAVFTFIIYPTCMPLRPASIEVDGLSTFILNVIYTLDANTDVCPSIHVIWALGILFAVWNDKKFSSAGWRTAWAIQILLICASTFMIKQHSIIDVAVAVPYGVIGWLSAYRKAHDGSVEKTAAAEDIPKAARQ